VPEFIESIFKRVDRGCSNNIFRQTIIPYICNSIAKRVFSEVITAATINEFPLVRHSDELGMLGVTKVSYLPAKILYVSIYHLSVCGILKLGV